MADGETGNDDETFGDPLPPEDRLWRHPSEMAAFDEPSARSPWGTALVSAAGGAFAVGAVWLSIGGGGDANQLATQWVSLVPVETVAPLVIPADEWTDEVSRLARPGTVAVRAGHDDTTIAAAVAVRDDGFYLTSGRAVSGNETVTIVRADGVSLDADVVGYDPDTDVSVLHVDASTTPAVVASGAGIALGDPVAIIDPDGDVSEHTVAAEAAMSETLDGDWLVGVVALDGDLDDAPPGSPAVDDTGAVVGVTVSTARGAPTFIVPIGVATDVATDLIETGVADHPRLGVTATDNDTPDTPGRKGARVTSVDIDGPAAHGGIVADDVVIEVDAVTVASLVEMVAELRTHQPGDVIEVVVMRDHERVGCVVELASACDGVCVSG